MPLAQSSGIQPHGPPLLCRHDLRDGTGHDIAGRELGPLVHFGQEAPAVLIAQHSALAAHRLGDQEGSGSGQCGGMELVELQVLERGTGPPGGGDAVPGRDPRIGGAREQLPGAAGGEQDRRCSGPQVGAVGRHQLGSDHAAALDQQVHHGGVLAHDDAGLLLRGRPQGPLDRPPGRIAAGMQDPRPAVSTLEAQRVGAARPLGPIEADAAVDQLGDRLRPLTAQHPHRLVLAQSHAGRPGVAGVLVGAVRGA